MQTISVVTAVHAGHFKFLDDAHASLREQPMPDGWDWEWLLQVDGPGVREIHRAVRSDERVRISSNRTSGPAATRTMALARGGGELVRVLDADDKLVPDALARDIKVLSRSPTVGWCVGPALDWHPDGRRTRWHGDDPAPGRLRKGWVLKTWRKNCWQFLPVLPSTLCIRRRLLLALGGWMALPTSEDTGLLVAAEIIADGWMHSRPVQLRRLHENQVTATPEHQSPAEIDARRHLIVERAESLQAVLGALNHRR